MKRYEVHVHAYGRPIVQRAIESYYGGDGPPTMREQQIAAYEEKRALKNGRNPS